MSKLTLVSGIVLNTVMFIIVVLIFGEGTGLITTPVIKTFNSELIALVSVSFGFFFCSMSYEIYDDHKRSKKLYEEWESRIK